MSNAGWLKCRFCWYSVPPVPERGRFKGQSGNVVLEGHVLEFHYDRLTQQERDALMGSTDDGEER